MSAKKLEDLTLKSDMNAKLRSFILKWPDLLIWYANEQKVIMFNFDGLYAPAERFIDIHASKFILLL